MGTRRGSFRRNHYRPSVEPLLIHGTRTWDWGDLAIEWAGAASLPPPRPRFPRRLALVLLVGLLLALLALPFLGCASTRQSRPAPFLPACAPVVPGDPACRGR